MRGVENVPYEGGGGPKPLLGWVSFARFSTPSFVHPPMASSDYLAFSQVLWFASVLGAGRPHHGRPNVKGQKTAFFGSF